jgi:hypothetical protein
MTTNNTYSKQEKLKSRKALEQLFAKGKSFSVFPIKVFYTVSDQLVGDVMTTRKSKSMKLDWFKLGLVLVLGFLKKHTTEIK